MWHDSLNLSTYQSKTRAKSKQSASFRASTHWASAFKGGHRLCSWPQWRQLQHARASISMRRPKWIVTRSSLDARLPESRCTVFAQSSHCSTDTYTLFAAPILCGGVVQWPCLAGATAYPLKISECAVKSRALCLALENLAPASLEGSRQSPHLVSCYSTRKVFCFCSAGVPRITRYSRTLLNSARSPESWQCSTDIGAR